MTISSSGAARGTRRYFPDNRVQRFVPGDPRPTETRGDRRAATSLQDAFRSHKHVDVDKHITLLKRSDYHVDRKTLQMAMDVTAKQASVTGCQKVAHRMQAMRLPYTIETYNAFMDLCLRLGVPEKCLLLKDKLSEKRVVPDAVTCLKMLQAYGRLAETALRAGEHERRRDLHRRALRVLQYLEESGYGADLGKVTASLLSASPAEAAGILRRTHAVGLRVDAQACGTLMRAAALHGLGGDVGVVVCFESLFELARSFGCEPDAAMHKSALAYHARRYDLRGVSAAYAGLVRAHGRREAETEPVLTSVLHALTPHVACGNQAALALADHAFRSLASAALRRSGRGKPGAGPTGQHPGTKALDAMAAVLGALAESPEAAWLSEGGGGGGGGGAREGRGGKREFAAVQWVQNRHGVLAAFASRYATAKAYAEGRGEGLGSEMGRAAREAHAARTAEEGTTARAL